MLKFHPLKILSVAPDAEDAVTLALEVPPALRAEFTGTAGQHVALRTHIDGQELRRTYSLLNAPGEWPLRIAARVHPHGVMSRYLAEQLQAGAVLDVLPPNGSFTPRAPVHGGHYLGFAAGCGITAVLAVVRSLLQHGASVVLFYGNTGTARAMCAEELLALKDEHLERLALHFVMSREPQEVALYNGRLDAARVRECAGRLFEPSQVREAFVCGPGEMIEDVSGALRGLGVDAARIHGEHFRVSAALPQAAAASPAPADAGLAEVSVLMDGRRRSFSMPMDSETVLDAAARAGIELPFSCRAGVCSTCRTKVTGGAVAMAQNYALEDWELAQGYVLACQARCLSPTLDLDYDEK